MKKLFNIPTEVWSNIVAGTELTLSNNQRDIYDV